MIKIKKVLPGARIIIELSIDENDNMESLDSGSGVRLSHLGSLLHEASRLNLEVVGLALNLDVSGCLDHEENLMYTDLDNLLPNHKHLLEQKFGALTEGPVINCQYWIIWMESAIYALEQVH